MRLSPTHRAAILRIVSDMCGPDARVRLFGSRVDDTKRGGDVDLLVELAAEPDDVFDLQRRLRRRDDARASGGDGNRSGVKVKLDENLGSLGAVFLRANGIDVVTAADQRLLSAADDILLGLGA